MNKKIKSMKNSFKYAIEGLYTGIIFGIILKISKIEWIICIILFGLVISAELMNTAIENVVDLVTMEKNQKAKIAKDVAAGAVLVTAISSAIIGFIIFLPKILK